MPREGVIEEPCHEDVWDLHVLIDAFLTLELDESECSNSRLVCFTPREIQSLIPT
jgi:hypothetical protein